MKSALFVVLVTVVTPGLDVVVVSDSMVVPTGRVGEGFGAIGARVGLLAGTVAFYC